MIQFVKKVLLFTALLFHTFHTYSQTGDDKNGGYDHSGFSLGLSSSIDLNLDPDRFALDEGTGYETDYDQFNYRVGLFVEYKTSGRFSVTSGMDYANKNFTGTYYCDFCDFGTPSLPEKIKLKYFEIPINGRYYFTFKKIKPYGEVGVVNQFVIKAENTNLQNRSDASTLESTYFLSGKIGAGASIKVAPTIAVQFGIEYLQGFINLDKSPDYNTKMLGFKIAVLKQL